MTAISPLVKATIDNYVAVMPAAHWDEVGQFVRDSVTRIAPQTKGVARHYLIAVARFALWVWQSCGLELEPDVFHPNLVGRFMREVMSEHSDHYRYHTAQRLSLMVAHYTGQAPARQHLAEPHASEPYARAQLVSFRSSAARRSNLARRSNAHILLGLGAGAGLRTEEIAAARLDSIHHDGQGLVVEVRGKYPRSVPVLADWESTLATGIDGRTGDDYAFTGYRIPGYASRVVHQFGIDDPHELTPSAARLRATWIVRQLDGGVPLDLILRLAGLSSSTSIAAYQRAMTHHPLADFRDLATGRERNR